MLGRSLALALVGLSALSQALPLDSETKAVSARQDSFTLGGSLPSDATTAIKEIEVALERLQDLPSLTPEQWREVGAYKALLFYVYGITSITAPDGTTTTLTFGKRQSSFTIGGALPSDETVALDQLQVALEQLQDKPYKTLADYELIGAIKALLFYKYGITSEYAPPGTTTTLTPGGNSKRQESFTLGGSLPSDEKQAIAELEADLEQLQNKPYKTRADWELIGAIKGLLYYTYGITAITAPDGTTTTFTIGKH